MASPFVYEYITEYPILLMKMCVELSDIILLLAV